LAKEEREDHRHRAGRQLRRTPDLDDHHDTGLYSWQVLHDLGVNYRENWERYLKRLKDAGYRRKE